MKRLLLLCFLLQSGMMMAMAQTAKPWVVSGMGDRWEATIVVNDELLVIESALPELPIPKGWRFSVMNEPGWSNLGNLFSVGRDKANFASDGAITHYPTKTTYLRWTRYWQRPDLLREHLIHELVHVNHREMKEQWVRRRTHELLWQMKNAIASH